MSGPDQINGLMIKVHGISKFGSTEEPTIMYKQTVYLLPSRHVLGQFHFSKVAFSYSLQQLILADIHLLPRRSRALTGF